MQAEEGGYEHSSRQQPHNRAACAASSRSASAIYGLMSEARGSDGSPPMQDVRRHPA